MFVFVVLRFLRLRVFASWACNFLFDVLYPSAWTYFVSADFLHSGLRKCCTFCRSCVQAFRSIAVFWVAWVWGLTVLIHVFSFSHVSECSKMECSPRLLDVRSQKVLWFLGLPACIAMQGFGFFRYPAFELLNCSALACFLRRSLPTYRNSLDLLHLIPWRHDLRLNVSFPVLDTWRIEFRFMRSSLSEGSISQGLPHSSVWNYNDLIVLSRWVLEFVWFHSRSRVFSIAGTMLYWSFRGRVVRISLFCKVSCVRVCKSARLHQSSLIRVLHSLAFHEASRVWVCVVLHFFKCTAFGGFKVPVARLLAVFLWSRFPCLHVIGFPAVEHLSISPFAVRFVPSVSRISFPCDLVQFFCR